MDVKQRQDVDQDIIGRESPELSQRVQTGGEVGVRVHDPLGPAGRSRAVKHQTWGIVGDSWFRETSFGFGSIPCLGVGQQGVQLRQLGPQRLDNRALIVACDHGPGATVLKEVTQLLSREPRVQGK